MTPVGGPQNHRGPPLRVALKDGTLAVPGSLNAQLGQICDILRRLSGRLEIKNAVERRQERMRQAVLYNAEIHALGYRIKHKTTYWVQFDNEKLIERCIKALCDTPVIPRTRLQWLNADIDIAIGESVVEATERGGAATVMLDETDIELSNVLIDLLDRTQLTRHNKTPHPRG